MSAKGKRITRLEAARPNPERQTLTMLWGSSADDAAAADLQRRADAEGKDVMIIKLVGPQGAP